MTNPLQGKRILVTGARGFLGCRVFRELSGLTTEIVTGFGSDRYDLRERKACRELLMDTLPDVVVHLAAVVGGIQANRLYPGKYFYDNAIMGLHLMEESRLAGVEKFVSIGTVCEYPRMTPVPFKESALWDGYPEETNAPYGLAKKMLLIQSQAYREQYGFNAIHLLMVNLYGPGDNISPTTSHVIPALIRKVLKAQRDGDEAIEVWGTGTATREFLYVDDAARAVVLATERYDSREPLNIGSGQEVLIHGLAEMICQLAGYSGRLIWNSDKPDGQPRRCLDVSRARNEIGYEATTTLRDGLQKTIEWMRTCQSL